MTEKVVVKQIYPIESGVSSKGTNWTKQSYLAETFGKYPRKIFFSVLGDNINKMRLVAGGQYQISFDIESRAFTGRDGVERWVTNVTAYNAEPIVGGIQPVQQTAQQNYAPQQPQYANAQQPSNMQVSANQQYENQNLPF